ncbi:MAG: indolepyruvate ferredoxin oxidoreductase subunit alpha [Lentisphaerae bacterium]|jgi:indolepyruvate ferredoxin oxidoreductase alpha subunit|nr:indolepyruvate ferredoxin oxidoreductase subunit alpha [Lentisphaerota bacterium]
MFNKPNLKFLSGDEAVAYGAYRAGCHVATAYPGTPSTEILETIAKFNGEINCEWSVNEKVAVEVAIGASIAGARSLAAMKHVGVNVAMDPIMTFTYTGVNGGMVVAAADDPSLHSSQNEQDTRNLVKFAKAALFEPSDSQEAYDMTREAFELSERTGAIVFVRLTTRTAHTSSMVDLGDDFGYGNVPVKEYVKNVRKYVAVPANARVMRYDAEKRLALMKAESEKSKFNTVRLDGKEVGVVTSGVAYGYVMEHFEKDSVLKLGFSNPLPLDLIRDFASKVEKLYVVEELDPVIRDGIAAAGIKVEPHDVELSMMELNPDRVGALYAEIKGLKKESAAAEEAPEIPALPTRPPVLCAGCSHRGVFHMLSKLKAVVSGDIGCYTLGSVPPLSAMDTTICMGASIGAAFGMEKAGLDRKIAAVIGDSTFFHSGMTGLLNVVYNNGAVTVIVLDNRITGMTGHQNNPGSGKTLSGEDAPQANIAEICRALGVRRVFEVDAYDLKQLEEVIGTELEVPEPSVIVAYGTCVLAVRRNIGATPYKVDPDKCVACGVCFRIGCPAIVKGDPKGRLFKSYIEPTTCVGCTTCSQVCKFGAISSTGEEENN